jgi:hypothetical protein
MKSKKNVLISLALGTGMTLCALPVVAQVNERLLVQTDNGWYPASIVSVLNDRVDVKLDENGRIESVAPDKLRPIYWGPQKTITCRRSDKSEFQFEISKARSGNAATAYIYGRVEGNDKETYVQIKDCFEKNPE